MRAGRFSFGGVGAQGGDGQKQVLELSTLPGVENVVLAPFQSGTYEMTPGQRVDWEAEVRSLYDGMVRIVVTPTWAKLIDFETTLPSAVEELARQRDERQHA